MNLLKFCFEFILPCFQAYQSLASEEDRKELLSGLLVRSGGNERRVGPEVSARVYRCLTAKNPQLVLD